MADTRPKVTRSVPPVVAAAPKTGLPRPSAAPSSGQAIGCAPVVSTETTARSPSASTPVTVPRVERPSPNVTVTSPPRRLWALVRIRPSAMTTPAPRAWRPTATMDGPTVVATRATASDRSVRVVMGS